MPIKVTHLTETAETRLFPSIPLPVDQNLRFSLQDTRSKRYLTPTGWSGSRKTLFEASLSEDNRSLVLNPEIVSQLTAGTPLLLEEIYVNYREGFIWPDLNVQEDSKPEPEAEAIEPQIIEPPLLEETTAGEAPQIIPETENEVSASVQPVPARRSHAPGLFGVTGLLLGAGAATALLLTVFAPVKTLPPPPAPAPAAASASTSEVTSLKNRIAELVNAETDRILQLNSANAARNKLQSQLETLQRDLAAAKGTGTPQNSTAQLEQQKATIAQLQDELTKARAASTRPPETADLGFLQEQKLLLQKKNDEQLATINTLRDQVMSMSKTISDWSQDRTAMTLQIRQLEQQVALMKVNGTSATPTAGTWIAAASSLSGSVEVATNQSSQQNALNAAVSLCKTNGGARCAALKAFPNGCIAVARQAGAPIRSNNFWIGNASSNRAAQNDAIEECFNANRGLYRCETAFVKCSN